jgi:SPP1 gp7 family putative phage head morphogenesis protein
VAIRADTLRLVAEVRAAADGLADGVTRRLVAAWARAHDEITVEFVAAVDDLVVSGDGQWPSRAQIARSARAVRALSIASEALERLADLARAETAAAAAQAAQATAAAQAGIIASQMPAQAGDLAALTARFQRVTASTLAQITARTTMQITSLTRPLSADATDAMRRELVRGVAAGDNPRVAARRMVARVGGAFDGGLPRALTIARTEILDAHRAAAAAGQIANADVLTGWVWVAQLGHRTCPACWAMHGTVHGVEEAGPSGHPNCRCTRAPQTRPWRALGFDIDEPPSLVPDAQARFTALPRATQVQIMGPGRLAALDSGQVTWTDLARRTPNPGWRDSYTSTPVSALV